MSNFRQVDRETGFLLPDSVDEWLPERHLARFVVDVVDQLELSAFVKAYRGSGSASYHPSVLLGLLVYGYATGVFSSRKLERATYDSVAFRFIAANDHPDHDTIAAFRRRFLGQIEGLFVEVLVLAREAGMLRLGTVALDGTKVHANASRHSALSYKHACEIEARLEAEVAELMALALCHSRMPFVRAYPRETQEMVFDAHDKAFAFSAGPVRGVSMTARPCPPLVRGQWSSEDGGGRDSCWQGADLQSPVPTDVRTLSGRSCCLHACFGLGEGSGREPGRRTPAKILCAATKV